MFLIDLLVGLIERRNRRVMLIRRIRRKKNKATQPPERVTAAKSLSLSKAAQVPLSPLIHHANERENGGRESTLGHGEDG